jgi:hypothetical protein
MSTAELYRTAMSVTEQYAETYIEEAPELRYRAVSGMAVFALVVAVLSLPALALPAPISLPFMAGSLLSAILGIIAARTIKQRPEEFMGGTVALAGTLIGAATLVIGISWNAYVTATEVPEGYTRVSFGELQPSYKTPELPFSKRALELDGKRVYIRGYTAPGDQKYGQKEFILVKDIGACCFGDQPKPTHMVAVTFTEGLTIDYGYLPRGLGGILRVDKEPRQNKLGGAYFRLEADHLR